MTSILRMIGSGLGLVVVAVALYDLVATTVSVSRGAGPIASRVAAAVWRGFLTLLHRTGIRRHLAWGGPVTLIVVLGTWFVLLVGGWTLVMGWPGVVVEGSSEDPATLLRQFEHAASLVIGSGGPDVGVTGGGWGLVSQAAALSGLGLLSLSIAYVLPVVNAVVSKRKVAATISALGHTPGHLLDRAWNGEDFGVLRLHLIPLTVMLAEVAEQHLAYPVVHQFHSVERHTALGPSLVVLDDALTILECCKQDARLEASTIIPLRVVIAEVLDTLEGAFVAPSDDSVPVPDIDAMRHRGLPLLPDADCADGFERVAARRRLLRALLEHDGWTPEGLAQGGWGESAMLRGATDDETDEGAGATGRGDTGRAEND